MPRCDHFDSQKYLNELLVLMGSGRVEGKGEKRNDVRNDKVAEESLWEVQGVQTFMATRRACSPRRDFKDLLRMPKWLGACRDANFWLEARLIKSAYVIERVSEPLGTPVWC